MQILETAKANVSTGEVGIKLNGSADTFDALKPGPSDTEQTDKK